MSKGLGRILAMGLWTFVLSAALSSGSGAAAGSLNVWFSIGILMVIVATGILFDIVGTAATAASEAPMNAMAANRVYGATEALTLVRNAPAVANFCNDFIGDICGTVSGAVGATIILRTGIGTGRNAGLMPTAVVALVSAVTVAGKAAGKEYAMNSADSIILQVGRIVAVYDRVIGRDARGKNGRNKRRRRNGN